MKIKITNPSWHSAYAKLTEGHFADAIRTATQHIDSDGHFAEKHLYFMADPDADLQLDVVHHICLAVQIALGGSLVWDIVTELPEPLRAEDGIMAYLYTSQCKL